MKPRHVVVLVLAGALSGALMAIVTQRMRRTQPAAVAQSQAQTQAAVQPAPPPVAPQAAAEPALVADKPSPLEPKRPPTPVRQAHPAGNPEPVATAQTAPPPEVAPPSPDPMPSPAVPQPPVAAEPARPEPALPAPAAPPPPNKVTLNAGILLPVRLIDGLSTERNHAGDAFTATLDKELAVDGFVIAERGARVEGRVVSSDPGGKVSGLASLAVELTRLRLSDGQTVALATDSFQRRAEQTKRQDAEKVGGGAALGAVIGAIARGGKGAAIGAGAGGGAGAGAVLLTRGQPATLPSEIRLSFRISAPVTITEQRTP